MHSSLETAGLFVGFGRRADRERLGPPSGVPPTMTAANVVSRNGLPMFASPPVLCALRDSPARA
jgi:hypothetical protein